MVAMASGAQELARAQELVDALASHYQALISRENCSAEDAGELHAQGSVLLLELKAQHRAVCEATEVLKETSRDARVELDRSSLTLKNLLYEQEHYAKEIRACRSFRCGVLQRPWGVWGQGREEVVPVVLLHWCFGVESAPAILVCTRLQIRLRRRGAGAGPGVGV